MIAAMAVPQIQGLQIALVHLLFNLSGAVLLYPIPALRQLPLRCARALADLAVRRRTAVVVYLVTAFLILPLLGALVLR
jgi:solute carrier family 34 (sodium-dependent phosphate cotransporter)